MSRDVYSALSANLAWGLCDDPENGDKFWKVRELLDFHDGACARPLSRVFRVAIDEKLQPWYGRCPAKQYPSFSMTFMSEI